jgi:hypothetical protein
VESNILAEGRRYVQYENFCPKGLPHGLGVVRHLGALIGKINGAQDFFDSRHDSSFHAKNGSRGQRLKRLCPKQYTKAFPIDKVFFPTYSIEEARRRPALWENFSVAVSAPANYISMLERGVLFGRYFA